MQDFKEIFHRILRDARYQKNIHWGSPREGHPEGTVKAHIAELEKNLSCLKECLPLEDYWKLRILIHVHDTFKAEARAKVSILDPHSHASIAARFLAEFCEEPALCAMVQYHDEPFALWRQQQQKGKYNQERMKHLLEVIEDWRLYLQFLVIDGATIGKSRDPLHWVASSLGPEVGLDSLVHETLETLATERG